MSSNIAATSITRACLRLKMSEYNVQQNIVMKQEYVSNTCVHSWFICGFHVTHLFNFLRCFTNQEGFNNWSLFDCKFHLNHRSHQEYVGNNHLFPVLSINILEYILCISIWYIRFPINYKQICSSLLNWQIQAKCSGGENPTCFPNKL